MRFFTDHDVDAAVSRRLRALGHDAWTAEQAGLRVAADDSLTVYAHSRGAVLITHDKEFSRRRRKNVVGWHIWLRCDEWDAADLLDRHLDTVLPLLRVFDDLFIVISHEGFEVSHSWQ